MLLTSILREETNGTSDRKLSSRGCMVFPVHRVGQNTFCAFELALVGPALGEYREFIGPGKWRCVMTSPNGVMGSEK